MGVSARFAGLEDESEAKVGNAGGQVVFQQNVLRLEVTVSDGRFTKTLLVRRHLLMQVHQSASHALSDTTHVSPRHNVGLEIKLLVQEKNYSCLTNLDIYIASSSLNSILSSIVKKI